MTIKKNNIAILAISVFIPLTWGTQAWAFSWGRPKPSPSPSPTFSPSPTPTRSPTPSPSPSPSPTLSPSPTPTVTHSPSPTPSPTPTQSPSPTPTAASGLTAVWANDGGNKVSRDEKRGTQNVNAVINSVWTGSKIQVFGGRNEVISFNLVLEAGNQAVQSIEVGMNSLSGPAGSLIRSSATTGDGVFNWNLRDIELFYVRYLPIRGLSRLSYEMYDERHIPQRFRRPWTGEGYGSGTWYDRPDHDKFYPEIAVPMEVVNTFNVAAGQNQSIWVDIYIPKAAEAGIHTGSITIKEGGKLTKTIPVELDVMNFTLPDTPNSKTMVYLGYGDINQRYTGTSWPTAGSTQDTASKLIRDRHFMLAHRHKLSLIDDNSGAASWSTDAPRPEWVPRLKGSLFTSANGYKGPGENVGNGVFSIGTYGKWGWKSEGQSGMWTHSNNWVNWFNANSPSTEYFLYLIDESSNYAQIEQWAQWIQSNPGVGKSLMSMATISLPNALANAPSLDVVASWFTVGDTTKWQNAANTINAKADKRFYLYNGKRPANGSFATEDDGIALRQLPWGQYKKGVKRWFFWESTYYNDFQGGRGQNNLFNDAQTFGGYTGVNSSLGRTGWNYSNGDGVLFYPGTDKVFTADSYGLQGPLASLRMKHWRRGIQDVDYIKLAAAIDPTRVQQIVQNMIPKVLWDYGIADPSDPTWVRANISWSNDPEVWENARKELANIIEGN